MAAVIEDRLPAEPKAPAQARSLVRELELDEETRQNVELIVSELVSNSVKHTGDGPRTVRLKLECREKGIKGEVCDDGSGFDWTPHEPELDEPGGLGLMVVDSLAENWGIKQNSVSCVWFECACSASD